MSDDQTPWTEEQWDAFMKHADLRAARYAELMETLMDHPDRDDIIDNEMGWNRGDKDSDWFDEVGEAEDDLDGDADDAVDLDDADEPFGDEPAGEPHGGSALEEMAERDRALRRIPAYAMALSIAVRLMQQMHPAQNKDADEELVQAMRQANIAAAKIAGGHAMGYDDEVLGGNVVNCKRALAAAEECRAALGVLLDRRLLPADQIEPIARDNAELIPLIQQRIEELRARMWWQQR